MSCSRLLPRQGARSALHGALGRSPSCGSPARVSAFKHKRCAALPHNDCMEGFRQAPVTIAHVIRAPPGRRGRLGLGATRGRGCLGLPSEVTPLVLCFGLAAIVGTIGPPRGSHVIAAASTSRHVLASDASGGGRWHVIRIAGDGNCLFRAVAQGAARIRGQAISAEAERAVAAELRTASVAELERRKAEIEWAVEGDFHTYCRRMRRSGEWGGEIELIMLAHVLRLGIDVAILQPDGSLRVIVEYSPDAAALARPSHGVYGAAAGGKDGFDYNDVRNSALPRAVERMRLLLHLAPAGGGHYELLVPVAE